jgi:predicted short-subunit dehydrogenase-like oxidoreductase (DUF2520 family)
VSPCWVREGLDADDVGAAYTVQTWVSMEGTYLRQAVALDDQPRALITVQKRMRDACEAIRDRQFKQAARGGRRR